MYGQQLTLNTCIQQAIENHPDIKNSELDMAISKAPIDQAWLGAQKMVKRTYSK